MRRISLSVALLLLAAAGLRAQSVTTTLSVGTFPDAVAVNPVSNNIYVANYESGNVTVINGATNATTTVAVGAAPVAVAAWVWCTRPKT